MTVESVTYIDDLDVTLPPHGDTVGEADDHIRNIKLALKNTFPNINNPVTATEETINAMDSRVATVEGQYIKKNGTVAMTGALNMSLQRIVGLGTTTLNDDAATKGYVDTAIANAVWTYLQIPFPAGCLLLSFNPANPSTYLGFGTWTLFGGGTLLMAAGSYTDARGEFRDYGGAYEKVPGGEYQHVLTGGEMPSHNHTVTEYAGVNSSGQHISAATTGAASGTLTSTVGGSLAHNNMPPFSVVYVWKRTS